jgi:hypothetical protein
VWELLDQMMVVRVRANKERLKSTARKCSFLLKMFLHKSTQAGYIVKKQRGSYEKKWHYREE